VLLESSDCACYYILSVRVTFIVGGVPLEFLLKAFSSQRSAWKMKGEADG